MPTSTTPRSRSPVKGPSTEEFGYGDVSMMVEPPTDFMDEEQSEQSDQSEHPGLEPPQEETTVRLFPQSFQPQSSSQHPPQIARPDQNQDASIGNAQGRRYQTQTPELQKRLSQKEVQPSPNSPGRLVPFDWDEFEARYQKALDEADEQEKELLEEFDHLVRYFNAWASASSAHDNERAVKRLQTRERHVRISEQALSQRKKHLAEVMKAFKSALALLSTT
ncbi:hypothetical protein SLS62_000291 [Diatrype stigma]|uniref:Uncharacterized protein n=1 Tax=Diatrype stigma TaxID=117547 RepID=A0AAN9VD23_9PEZI